MAARGSKLSRMLEFFKTGDIEEVRFVSARATDIVRARLRDTPEEVTPRRSRRTKAQLASNKGKDAHTAMGANG
jgi:hypothetical protein